MHAILDTNFKEKQQITAYRFGHYENLFVTRCIFVIN